MPATTAPAPVPIPEVVARSLAGELLPAMLELSRDAGELEPIVRWKFGGLEQEIARDPERPGQVVMSADMYAQTLDLVARVAAATAVGLAANQLAQLAHPFPAGAEDPDAAQDRDVKPDNSAPSEFAGEFGDGKAAAS